MALQFYLTLFNCMYQYITFVCKYCFMKKVFLFILFFMSLNLWAQHKPFQFGFCAAPNMGWFASGTKNYQNQSFDLGASWSFINEIFLMDGNFINIGFNMVFLNSSISFPYYAIAFDNSKTYGTLIRKFKNKTANNFIK